MTNTPTPGPVFYGPTITAGAMINLLMHHLLNVNPAAATAIQREYAKLGLGSAEFTANGLDHEMGADLINALDRVGPVNGFWFGPNHEDPNLFGWWPSN